MQFELMLAFDDQNPLRDKEIVKHRINYLRMPTDMSQYNDQIFPSASLDNKFHANQCLK